MRRIASLAPVLLASILGVGELVRSQNTDSDVFIEKPYLQLGDAPKLSSPESLVLLWHTNDQDAEWRVEVQAKDDKRWAPAAPPSMRRVDAPGIPIHRIYSAELIRLSPGDEFSYRVARNKKTVFEAVGRRMFNVPTLPNMMTGATDNAQLRAKGVQAYGTGPIVTPEEGPLGGAHADDEHIPVRSLMALVEYMWNSVVGVAAAN